MVIFRSEAFNFPLFEEKLKREAILPLANGFSPSVPFPRTFPYGKNIFESSVLCFFQRSRNGDLCFGNIADISHHINLWSQLQI